LGEFYLFISIIVWRIDIKKLQLTEERRLPIFSRRDIKQQLRFDGSPQKQNESKPTTFGNPTDIIICAMPKPNILITGTPGTGKTSLAEIGAELLGLVRVDVNEVNGLS
jgi:Cdc6-like AAA superfamily ATPase